MSKRIRVGLIVGGTSLIIAVFWNMFIGICGPIVPLIGGLIAGHRVVREEMSATKREGGLAGAIAGVIAGGLSLVGYVIGWIASWAFNPGTFFLDSVNSPEQVSPIVFAIYSLFGEQGVIVLCTGLLGMALAGVAGFFGGYLEAGKIAKSAPPLQ